MTRLKLDWTPHAGQQEVLADDSRFRIVACGRRWGKTELAGHALFKCAAESDGGLFWWVAPTYRISDTGFDMLEGIVPRAFREGIKRSKPKRIDLVNGASIEFRTTDREDGLVGEGVEMLVIDEAAMVPERAWKKELRPTLSDTLGEMIAISTPSGRNWFHDYFERGQGTDYEDVTSWRQSTYQNPHIPDSEVDAARDELPERIFKQEYLAEFVDDTGGVFERVRDRVVTDYDPSALAGEPPYAIGVDFARHQDYTVIVALDSEARLVAFKRLRNGGEVSWPQIQRAIENVYAEYPGPTHVDASRDNKIVSDLDRAGVDVEPIKFTSQKKTQLVENLAASIEREELTLPDIPQLISELQIFEYDVTRSGNVRYHAPEGHHDDCVDALALALEAQSSGGVPTTTVTFDEPDESTGGLGQGQGLPGLGGGGGGLR